MQSVFIAEFGSLDSLLLSVWLITRPHYLPCLSTTYNISLSSDKPVKVDTSKILSLFRDLGFDVISVE
jgi:hypothetical protein